MNLTWLIYLSINANWHYLLDKLNQALMKYTNQSICVFSVFFLLLLFKQCQTRQCIQAYCVLHKSFSYLEVCILWELMIWNRFIIHFTTMRSREIDMINWYLQAFNIFLMHLINCFPQTLSAVQSAYGSLQVLITPECLNKQLRVVVFCCFCCCCFSRILLGIYNIF